MAEVLIGFLKWFWGVVTHSLELAQWLFLPLADNPNEIAQLLASLLSYVGLANISPIGLVGIGAGVGGALAIIIGFVRAIA